MRIEIASRVGVVVLLFLVFQSGAALSVDKEAMQEKSTKANYVEGVIMVKYRVGVTKEVATKDFLSKGCTLERFIEGVGIYTLKIPAGKKVLEVVRLFEKDPLVQWSEPLYTPKLF